MGRGFGSGLELPSEAAKGIKAFHIALQFAQNPNLLYVRPKPLPKLFD
jgi:hypothetical protein